MNVATMEDLYLQQLRDSRNSETQIVKALPKMAAAAANAKLKAGFEKHLKQTMKQVERLDAILERLGKSAGRKVCEAMVGLIKEGSDVIKESEEGDVGDAGLICSVQKIEHYEIACYGCLAMWAKLLDRADDVKLLETTLREEKETDEELLCLLRAALTTMRCRRKAPGSVATFAYQLIIQFITARTKHEQLFSTSRNLREHCRWLASDRRGV